MDRRAWNDCGCAGLLLLALAGGDVNGASVYASALPRGPLYTFSRPVAVVRGDGLPPAPGEPELGRYRKWIGTNRVKKGGEHQLVSQMAAQLAQVRAGVPVAPAASRPRLARESDATVKAEEILWGTLGEREAGWSRIHAAEALVQLGHGSAVAKRLTAQLPEWEGSPQRIGAWRVLATCANSPAYRERWRAKMERVARDPAAADRLQAVESLGKMGWAVTDPTLSAVRAQAGAIPAVDALFPLWVLHLSGDPAGTRGLLAGLGAADPALRRRAAFVVRRLNPLPAEIRAALTQLARTEPTSTAAFPYVLAAALTHEVATERPEMSWAELERVRAEVSGPVQLEIVQVVLPRLDAAAMSSWVKNLESEERASRIAAAWAVLQMARPSRGDAEHPSAKTGTARALP